MSMTNEEASNILRLVATEALEGVSRFVESEKNRDLYKRAYEMAIKSLKESVSVVRCKDCCYWDRETVRQNSNDVSWWNEAVCRQHSVDGNEPHEMWTDADWFCKGGERRSE